MGQNTNTQSEISILREKNQNLEIQNKKIQEDNKRLNRYVEILESAIKDSRRKMFAPSSEKLTAQEQLNFCFNEAEKECVGENLDLPIGGQDEEETTVTEHQRKRGRKPLPADLPREEVTIDLEEEEKSCPIHKVALKEIGRDISEKLEIIPMQVKVIRTIRIKYSNVCCEKPTIKAAALPEEMIPKSNTTPGLLSFVATSKFNDGLPFYRLQKIFERYGMEISRGAMAQWMIKVAEKMSPLYFILESELLSSTYMNCDETTVQVLKEDGRKATSTSYMWVRARSGSRPIVLFKYAPSRSGATAKELLKDYKGYLQVDGYGGYDGVCDGKVIIRIGCLYHVRRKFYDSMKSSNIGKKIAENVIKTIKLISNEDEKLKKLPESERLAAKNSKVKPLFEKLKVIIDENLRKFPPKTQIGRAFNYANNEWENLEKYFDRAEFELSNNFIENAIRPFALTRKNWLFFDSVEGAQASEVIYSIMETAKANGHDPYHYLKKLFEELPKTKSEDLKTLLPF